MTKRRPGWDDTRGTLICLLAVVAACTLFMFGQVILGCALMEITGASVFVVRRIKARRQRGQRDDERTA